MSLKRIIVCLFILSLCFGENINFVEASENTFIRVCLYTKYNNKSSITINNSDISIGYCIDNEYIDELSLKSLSGFIFKPDNNYYYISDNTYLTYDEVKSIVEIIELEAEVKLNIALIGRNSWKIYIGADTKNGAKSIYEKVKDMYDITYSDIKSSNKNRVSISYDENVIIIDAEPNNMYPQIVANDLNSSGLNILDLGEMQYRDRIEIGQYGNSNLTAINVVDIENYLYGVVPCEMSASWHTEALKAQAVVSRSYAVNRAGFGADSNLKKPYKLKDNTSSQVYKGYSSEKINTNIAVDDTKGVLVYYNDSVAETTFFSTSGGATENALDVWKSDYPYLQGVSDIYETQPEKKPWIYTFKKQDIQKILNSHSKSISNIYDIKVTKYTDSFYVSTLSILGDSAITVEGQNNRTYFSLPSNKFKVISSSDNPDSAYAISENGINQIDIGDSYILSSSETKKASDVDLEQYIVKSSTNLSNYPKNAPTDEDTYIFAGMGYGHGVGMSQSGANGMAKNGYTYIQIIEHYYKGVTVK